MDYGCSMALRVVNSVVLTRLLLTGVVRPNGAGRNIDCRDQSNVRYFKVVRFYL
jgi:hypothetical protein